MKIYALYDIAFDPKWFPAFYVLLQKKELSITEIAQIIGSHPSVSQIVKEMTNIGLTTTAKSVSDARVNVVKLSDRGQQLIPTIKNQCIDVTQAAEELVEEMQYDLWKAIEEMEFCLRKDFYTVREKRKARESQQVEIIDYSPEFTKTSSVWTRVDYTSNWVNWPSVVKPPVRENFATWWAYFNQHNREIVGTCALIKTDDDTYELAKMAVTERARGKTLVGCLGRLLLMLFKRAKVFE